MQGRDVHTCSSVIPLTYASPLASPSLPSTHSLQPLIPFHDHISFDTPQVDTIALDVDILTIDYGHREALVRRDLNLATSTNRASPAVIEVFQALNLITMEADTTLKITGVNIRIFYSSVHPHGVVKNDDRSYLIFVNAQPGAHIVLQSMTLEPYPAVCRHWPLLLYDHGNATSISPPTDPS